MISGNLSRTPFAHVLLYVREHGLSGTLAIWPAGTSDESVARGEANERADRLYFHTGARRKGRLTQPASSLERGLLPLFQRLDGPFVFYPDADYVGTHAAVQPAEGSDLALITASMRGPVRDDVIDSVLGRFGTSPIHLRADADLRALELLPREQVVLDVLRNGAAPIAELVEHGGMEPRTARKVLYLLAITKTIEPMEDRAVVRPTASDPPMEPASPPSKPVPSGRPSSTPPRSTPRAAERVPDAPPEPPSDLSPEHRILWDELVDRARKIDEQNFFEMLGIESTAGGDAATAAYFELVKRLHPDRLPAALAPLNQLAQQVFSVLTDAHDTLLDEGLRLRYLGIVRDGGGTPAAQRKLEQTIEGTVEFQKAEVLHKSDPSSAERHVRRAIELDPDQADYYALLAWILFERHPGDGAPLDEMLALVDKAIGMHEKHARAHYYRGAILRRCGRETDAVLAFRRAVEFNPKNVDAQREVRIADMRAKRGGGKVDERANAAESSARSEAPKTGAKRDLGDLFKGLFGSKKK